jgi:hypothetical protein
MPRHSREQTVIGEAHFLANVHEQETTCPKAAFHFPGLEACLPKQRRLLIH